MINRVGLFLGSGFSIALLAACGGSSPSSSGSGSTPAASSPADQNNPLSTVAPGGAGADVCAAIGAAGAKAILGVDVGAPVKTSSSPYPNCLYGAADKMTVATVSMTVFTGGQAADGLFAGASQVNATVAVPGVGDKALSDPNGYYLMARKGSTGCAVVLAGGNLPGTPQSRQQQMGAFCAKALGG
jgi:hypothetical protein